MARPPITEEGLVARYGPHLNEAPPGGWNADLEIDRQVKTHCCFCGQQCGIILKVHANEVVGFEPWYEFPFNEGKLCPKGVKRYLQGNHPDRLLEPLARTVDGFEPVSWDTALDRVTSEIRRIQDVYRPDSFAIYGGASLTTEKAYLLGKFARLAVGTANIDYNGRLCMVSAGAAYKRAFGIDRAPNPWADIPLADVVFIAGANVAECAPITTSYVWRARDRGGKLIVADPRVTPLARTADVFLGLRPGTDSALMGTILHVLIERDWLDHDFIEAHTEGFEDSAAAVREYTPAWGSEVTGVAAARIEEAAELWGTAATGMLLHARGIEHQSKGVENVLSCINLALATGRIGQPGQGVCMITGQGNGQGGREHGQKAEQLPGAADIENPEHREYIASVWGCAADDIPGRGLTAQEIMQAIHAGEIKGLLSICFNPVVSLPQTGLTTEALDRLEFFGVVDFFLSETAFHADVVLPGSLHEEDEGVVCTTEGRVVKINAAVDPPGNARRDWEIYCDLAHRLGRGEYFPYASTREIFEELRIASKGGVADYAGITWDRLEAEMGIFWPCPTEEHPGTPRLYEDLRFHTPTGRARFAPVAFRPPAEVVDDDYPIWFTTGRVISQYLSGTQTRRIGPLVHQYPEPLCEIHPRLAARHGIATGDLVRVSSRRGSITVAASVVSTIRPDTVFIPYHWAGKLAANQVTNPVLDPVSKIPEFKVCAVRLERVGEVGGSTDARDYDLRTRRYLMEPPGELGDRVYVIDPSRCIGCQACVHACEECGTHRGHSMMHLDFIDRGTTVQTVPMVCMHCEDPTCAEVCPADAIKQNEDGIVQSALKPRCIACSNCVYACPFGIPKHMSELDQMMKCDHCYDRTSIGLAPMCVSVCPSQALWFGTPEDFHATRSGTLADTFVFGTQVVKTKVQTVAREPGPITITLGRKSTHWLDDPFGLDDEEVTAVTEVPVDPPKWRRDFPYTSAGEDDVTRREFVRYLVLASGAFATGTVAIAAWSSLRPINHGVPRPIVALADVPVNGTHLFRYPTRDDPAILVRLPGDRLHAMSQKCTHLSCVVYYQADKQRMVCPCHEGVFDARGNVLQGPPQRPLGRIDVEVRDGTVWALGAQP